LGVVDNPLRAKAAGISGCGHHNWGPASRIGILTREKNAYHTIFTLKTSATREVFCVITERLPRRLGNLKVPINRVEKRGAGSLRKAGSLFKKRKEVRGFQGRVFQVRKKTAKRKSLEKNGGSQYPHGISGRPCGRDTSMAGRKTLKDQVSKVAGGGRKT